MKSNMIVTAMFFGISLHHQLYCMHDIMIKNLSGKSVKIYLGGNDYVFKPEQTHNAKVDLLKYQKTVLLFEEQTEGWILSNQELQNAVLEIVLDENGHYTVDLKSK